MSRPFGVLRTRRMRRRRKVNQSTQTQEAESTPPSSSEVGIGCNQPSETRTSRRKVNQSTQTQEASIPPPSSEDSETWTSKHSYKHFESGRSQDIWEKCNEVVERHDEKVCDDLKDEITFPMVVAGLFLAIVTAFTIESYKLLQEDKQDTMSDLLVEVVRLLNDTSALGHAQLPKPFIPDHRNIVVNQLWFLGSILSLVAVLIGTFCLQWISAFLRGSNSQDKSLSPTHVLATRHLRYAGLKGWGVHHAPEVLLLIVQLSIALFAAGLVYFLWNINRAAAIPTLVVASITGILLYIVNVMPFLQSLIGVVFPRFLTLQCPYKSPTSWLVPIIFDSFARTLSSFGKRWRGCDGVAGRLAAWLKYRPAPLGDYVWKAHDVSFAALQDVWHICSASYSIGLGLSSALDTLVLEPDAVDIIRHSVESLRSTLGRADNLFNVFGQTFHPVVKEFFGGPLRIHYISTEYVSVAERQTHIVATIYDLVNAVILQNLVSRSVKLRLILLKHRVELQAPTQPTHCFLNRQRLCQNILCSRIEWLALYVDRPSLSSSNRLLCHRDSN